MVRIGQPLTRVLVDQPSFSLHMSPIWNFFSSDRTNFLLNSGNYSKHGSGGGDRGGGGRRVRERHVRAAEGDSRC